MSRLCQAKEIHPSRIMTDLARRWLMRISSSIQPDPGSTPKNGRGLRHAPFTPKVRQKRKPPVLVKKPRIVSKSSHQKPTVEYSKKSEHVTSRGTEDEDSVLSTLRSLRVFNHDMKDELVRFFHTPDPMKRPQTIGLSFLAIGTG